MGQLPGSGAQYLYRVRTGHYMNIDSSQQCTQLRARRHLSQTLGNQLPSAARLSNPDGPRVAKPHYRAKPGVDRRARVCSARAASWSSSG
jgi:hypothetical protein